MKQTQEPPVKREDFPALVQRALAGEQSAYTALYEATAQEVYRSIHAMVRSEELTLDLQQEVYIQAFSHLDQLQDPEKLIPWLRAIAVNCTRFALRRQTPVLFSELEDGDGPALPELADEDPAHAPELDLERRENARLLREILDSLTASQRLLVGMYYYEQMPVGQIARDLGVSPGTVKTQLYRSRKKIETAVKRLEAQGVKLYGLSPLPFLLALLKKTEPAAEAEQAVLAGSLARAGLAAETAAIHVGRGFFETLGGKLVLGLLSAAAIGGGVLGYGWLKNHLLIGDTRPTEPIRIQHSIELPDDSGEELVPVSTEASEPDTEPEPVTELDSDEDLTQPVTEAAEPSTEAGKDATEHPTPAESNPPSIPTPTESESAQPMPSETSQRPDAEPICSWAWDTGDQMDWNTGATEAGYESRILTVILSPPGKPELYAEDALTKLFYIGSMFRFDRPQKGRFREFHQFGVEALGEASPAVDAEIILLAVRFLESLGLKELSLSINSVGDPACRPVYRQKLKDFFKEKLDGLCDDCRSRYDRNPMRILDCKNERCHSLSVGAPNSILSMARPKASAWRMPFSVQ